MKKRLVLAIAAAALVGCSDPSEPQVTSPPAQPAAQQTLPPVGDEVAPRNASDDNVRDGARATMGPADAVDVEIDAPAGLYTADLNHSNLLFSVRHLGVSNYVMRFTDFDVTVDIDPEDIPASSVTATIQAASVQTDYEDDYQAAHPESPFATWQEDLAMSDNFLNAGEYPEIRFTSTQVNTSDDGILEVEGDLELLGETRPVTLEVTVVGSAAEHPMMGGGLIGVSAQGAFKRSDFGMDHLIAAGVVGDEIRLQFEGELVQRLNNAEQGGSVE